MQFFVKQIPYFEEKIWKNHVNKRRKYLSFILQDVWIIDKTKEEIRKLFGEESNYLYSDRWSYQTGKNFFGKSKYLVIYFEENKVDEVKLENIK